MLEPENKEGLASVDVKDVPVCTTIFLILGKKWCSIKDTQFFGPEKQSVFLI